MIVVSRERNNYLQERPDQTHAAPVPPLALSPTLVRAVKAGEKRLQTLHKEFIEHDEDGVAIGRRTEPAGRVTILDIVMADVAAFDLAMAHSCGFKTIEAFRGAW